MSAWAGGEGDLLRLPSGRVIRGRGLRHGPPAAAPGFGLYLLGRQPPPVAWDATWVRWPDFRLPSDRAAAAAAFAEALRRSEHERVEVACGGGRGRTGTALACIAILDGVPADEAVAYVRRHYHPRAVETPWQKRYVRAFSSRP
nr:protein-tyrosine phosphatase family protein [Dactylosporangium thailandense]